MRDEEQASDQIAEALARLVAYRAQFATGSMVDPLSKLTTADLDIAIRFVRKQCSSIRS